MADIQSRDPLGTSAGQPGSYKPQSAGRSTGATDQARDTLRSVADTASDTWDDVSKRGAHYYRQGSQAVGNVDSATMTGFLVAGAVGFGIAWLIFGQNSRSGSYVARRMSASSERDY